MLTKIKKWFKSKTINTALIIALLGVLELNFQYLQGLLGGILWRNLDCVFNVDGIITCCNNDKFR